jgi:CHAT domain-containing protein
MSDRVSPPQSLGAKDLRAALEEASASMRDFEDRLARKSEAFAVASQPVTMDAVRSRLAPGSALIEWVMYRPFDARAPDWASRWGAPRYAVYILPAEGEPSGLDLGEAGPIDAAARAMRGAIAGRSGDVKAHARALHDLTFAKVAPLLGEVSTLVIAPDGELAQVPFEALMDADGRWLVERYRTSYLASGRDLMRLARPSKPSSVSSVLAGIEYGEAPSDAARSGGPRPGGAPEDPVVAGVHIGQRSGDRAFSALRWGPLPGTAREAAGLKQLPLFGGAPGAAPRSGPATENPLLRSGLALADANLRDRTAGADDGVLTALEAASLNLEGTELVVLSACETGVGEARRGEGIFGLQRALVLAGARTQVMSLWKVDDDATQALMVAYYERLAQGEGRAEAMRQVRLAMLSGDRTSTALTTGQRTACAGDCAARAAFPRWTHPYFWASFLVSGEVAPLSSPSLPREQRR